uniref:UNC80 domain-containing protein n=1 Tax=Loa loa TaxID=7209 RepID=A0A1I7VCG9_LOALO
MEANGAMVNKTPSKKADLNRHELIIHDNLEDFFDEGIVNDESGERCPPVILFLACLLLNEITAFLRETFQTIQRSRSNKGISGGTLNYDKLMSNRRWSILSNMFTLQQQQQRASSIQKSDRRISLSTNEENSSRSSHEHTEEITQQQNDKKDDDDPNGDRLSRYIDGERVISLSDQYLACKKQSMYERKTGEKCPHVRRSHTLIVPTHSMVINAIISKSGQYHVKHRVETSYSKL